MRLSNAERAGVALFLSFDWGGPMELLEARLDAYDALELGQFKAHIQPGKFGGPAELLDDNKHDEYILSRKTAEVLLELYPQNNTPSALGPAKVRFLRKLQAFITATKPKDKKQKPPTAKEKEPKK